MNAQPSRAIRLTLEFDDRDVKVVDAKSVKMTVPASDDLYGFGKMSGFWFELRGEDDECLYRKIMPDPMTDQLEAPSGDPERPFTRTYAERSKGVFTVLVPELSEGRQLCLCSSPQKDPTGPARPFASVDFRKPIGKVRKLSRKGRRGKN